MNFNTIKQVKVINLTSTKSRGSDLTIFDFVDKFFTIKRIFSVEYKNRKNAQRGFHAHKNCEQIITCLKGEIKFRVFDGSKTKEFKINRNKAIFVPNHIWTETTYLRMNTILICYCSNYYNEKSYIRDYEDYLKFRKKF